MNVIHYVHRNKSDDDFVPSQFSHDFFLQPWLIKLASALSLQLYMYVIEADSQAK